MADTPLAQTVKDRLTHYALYVGITLVCLLLFAGGVSVWNWIFPKPDKQINNPHVTALPGSHIGKIDQTNTQVLLDEKPWEVGLGVAGVRYDNKDGALVGGWIKRKW